MPSQVKRDKGLWRLVLVFLVFGAGIGIAGYLFYEDQKKHLKKHSGEALSAIADLKVNQISSWRREKLRIVTMPVRSPFLRMGIKEFLSNPSDPGRRKRVHDFITSLKDNYGFQDVILLDRRQRVALSATGARNIDCPHLKTVAAESFRKNQIIFADLHREETSGRIYMAAASPVQDPEEGKSAPMALLVFEIDPDRFLYPLIQSWPTPSRTAETLLVRREGEEVVYLNELRHRKDTALNLRLSVHEKHLPAAMAARGQTGIVEGRDYRGVPVLAVTRPIPDSPWSMVAKVERKEIYEPISIMAINTVVIVILLIAGSGIILALFWLKQRAEHSRKQAETELKHQALAQRFDYLSRYANDIILMSGRDLKIIEANERALRSYGYSREELIGMDLADLQPSLLRSDFEKQIGQIESTNGLIYETLNRMKDGTVFPVEISSRLIEIEGERVYQSIIRDISERRRAEGILRDKEAELAAIIENIPVVLLILDGERRIRKLPNGLAAKFARSSVAEMLGIRGGEALRCIHALDDPEGCGFGPFCQGCVIRDTVLDTFATGKTHLGREARLPFEVNGKAEEVCFLLSTVPLTIANEPLVLVCLEDITPLKRAQEDKAELQGQLRQAQKMEAIGQLAGGVAHDFNNILTVISGCAQLALIDVRAGDPLKGYLEEIKRASDRAASLTRQLLAFSRKQAFEPKVLDFNQVLKRLDKMLSRLIGEDIMLEFRPAEPLGKVKADPGQIEQVIINLALNARDAMPKGGKLLIETANVELDEVYARRHVNVAPGSYVMVSVSDTGVGMSQDVRERLFEPFFTTKEQGKGTGLGLSTVYGIVNQSGGSIWVYSEPGQGATFKIYLPRVDEPLDDLRKEAAGEIPRGSETVLLVEDEETVRNLAVRVLAGLGYRVLEAPDGGVAFELGGQYREPIHLLLTDVVMPGMSGRELALRLLEIHPEAKVLYMSGYTDDAIVSHGVLSPGVGFIQKPFTLEGLSRKVREVLDAVAVGSNL